MGEIADAAAYFLSNEDHEANQFTHEVLLYFVDTGKELYHVNANVEEYDKDLESWIDDMSTVIDGFQQYISSGTLLYLVGSAKILE